MHSWLDAGWVRVIQLSFLVDKPDSVGFDDFGASGTLGGGVLT